MTFSASDHLQVDVDRLLREIGYEVEGDDCTGWSWSLGPAVGALGNGGRHLPLDSAAEATAAAVADLVACVHDVIVAGKAVLDRWDRGDLAEPVRELDAALRCLDPCRMGARPADDADRRSLRLLRLASTGLTLDECLRVFGQRSDAEARLRTRLLCGAQGDIVAGEFTVVRDSVTDVGESHALAWVRIEPPL